MLRPFTFFLSRSPWLNSLILVGYFLLVVLPHELLGVAISKAFKSYSRDFYNNTVIFLFLVGSILLVFIIAKQIRKSVEKTKLFTYLFFHTLLIGLSFYYLIIVNIECIHFIQYAMFAILAYPLLRNFLDVVLLSLMASIIDEAYQYFYLSPQRTNYFDFNDIVLDLIGAGTGIIILYIYTYRSKKKKSIRPMTVLFAVFSTLIALAFFFKLLWVNPTVDSVELWTLIRIPEESFWTFLNFDIVYHVLKPWEGLILVAFLSIFYLSIEFPRRKQLTS